MNPISKEKEETKAENERLLKKIKKDLEVLNLRLVFAVDNEAKCSSGLVVEGEVLKRLQATSRACGFCAKALEEIRTILPD